MAQQQVHQSIWEPCQVLFNLATTTRDRDAAAHLVPRALGEGGNVLLTSQPMESCSAADGDICDKRSSTGKYGSQTTQYVAQAERLVNAEWEVS